MRQTCCCFLDSSILVSSFFGKFKPRIEKFWNNRKIHNIPYYLSSSVEKECNDKMENILDFIGDNILLLKMHIAGEKSRTQHEIMLGEQDIVLIELLIKDRFNELSQKAHSEGRQIPEIEQEFLRTLEESLADFLEERFKENASLRMEEIDNFLAKCLDDFLFIKEAFKEYRKSLTPIIQVEPDPKMVENIKKIGVPTKDSLHIASAMEYALSHKLSAVFVSVDYRTILCFQEELYQSFGVQVCDPVYAYHHLKNQEAFRNFVLSRSHKRQSSITAY
jgi:hypothetical protein